jgi:hypothetical protein
MKRFSRLWPCAAFLVVCWVFVLVVPPAERPPRQRRGWVEERLQGPAVEIERQRVLDDQRATAQRRVLVQQQIVEQVIARRLSLLEAAACWGAALEAYPGVNWEMYRRSWPGSSDVERHCWCLIDAVKFKLRKEPERAEAIGEALEAELRGHLKDGTLRLPVRC